MFIDEANIAVRAGRGGNGRISFRREKYVPKGGPDGGDGGDGGDVWMVVDPNRHTLLTFRHVREYAGTDGQPGRGKQMHGERGSDCIIAVPAGTIVEDAQTGQMLADLTQPGERVRVAAGGRGGRGNVHFKSSVRRAPRIATDGTEGEERELKLTLKLLADVGLVGLPNVGKSTLLRRLSAATPRVGDYPFTTLRPVLGIVPFGEFDSCVMADLPGLVEGAHVGRGLGHRFLRHIERTRVLLYLIDAGSEQPEKDLAVLEGELGSFSPALLRRPRLVCYSRADLAVGRELPALGGKTPLRLSGSTGEGVATLLARLRDVLGPIRARGTAVEGRDTGAAAGREAGTDVEMAGADGAVDGGDRLDDGARMDVAPRGAADAPGEEADGRWADAERDLPFQLSYFADAVDLRGKLGPHPWPRRRVVPSGVRGPDPSGGRPERDDCDAGI